MIHRTFKPKYLWQLLTYGKKAHPLFLTRDTDVLSYIQKAKGICLLCNMDIDANRFDLSICSQNEAWVFYSDDQYQEASLELGLAIRQYGANKILVLPFAINKEGLCH